MIEDADSEKLKYLKNIIFLNIQRKEMIELAKDSIKGQKPIKCKLVNKDIINDYLRERISFEIYFDLDTYKIKNNLKNYSELYNQNHINKIIKEKYDKINDINLEDKYLNPGLLIAEESKLHVIEYPSNFFILRESVFNEIINITESVLVEFKTYDALIGEEGIFILDEKPNETNEFKFIIYYIKEIQEDEENNINKIILLKKKPKENLDKYLELAKYKNKSGYFNVIDDGKIIGKYLNIIKNTNYQYRESNIDCLIQSRMRIEVNNLEKNLNSFDLFLPHIIISLLNVEKLKQYFLNKEKIYEKNELFKIFINIIKKLDSDKYDFDSEMKNFINKVHERNLYEKLEISENKKEICKNLINLLLDEFQNELNKQKEKNEISIFDIFNGIKNVNSIQISFNNIMDLKYKSQGCDDTDFISSIYNYRKEENIHSFPEVMILSVYDKSNFNIPIEFQIKPSETEIEEKKYILRSSISFLEDNMSSIIRNKNIEKFYKLKITGENAIGKEEINDMMDISKGFIFLYEGEKIDNKKEEGNTNHNKNEQHSIDNKNDANQTNKDNNNKYKGYNKIYYNCQIIKKNNNLNNKIINNDNNDYNKNNFNNNYNLSNNYNNYINYNNNFSNYNTNNNNNNYNNNCTNYNNYNTYNYSNYNNNYFNNSYYTNMNNNNSDFMLNNQGKKNNNFYH